MSKPVIGFIGIGLMGHGIAKNILEGGYPLVTMAHRNRAPLEDLVSRGATEAAGTAELARQCDIIFLCVTGSPQIEALVRGADGIAANAKPGSILVDCSTADPTSTEGLAEELAEKGISMADAPLGGTPAQAEEGELSAIVGADPETFARIEPVLATWAANVLHLGPVGQGHKMKLINNFISLGQGALLAEGMAMARKAGLTVEQFHTVIGSSRMHNGFYDTFMKWTLEHDENAHKFTISNAHKDMRYLASLAIATGAVTPVQAALRNDLCAMEAAGQGGRYVPMLADFIAEVNGLDTETSE
ncbi:NAD(P)-dependent oxidoreductase [Tropicimonas sp. IMCC6043]|uniref:NAD(P)-dependent oxidoreductase n=1 Tax=Tropicimonas sp. IMCC6043 TaxID=2510645 RepID=UPI00101C4D8D|nr:NAD(P)-dependent oxidoreductase [Tropicimonas sp. IMCC6043]RYH08538.1 NAD(P)-dependent oxidoreductase [Tropicimonas sp. IMCC6043]